MTKPSANPFVSYPLLGNSLKKIWYIGINSRPTFLCLKKQHPARIAPTVPAILFTRPAALTSLAPSNAVCK